MSEAIGNTMPADDDTPATHHPASADEIRQMLPTLPAELQDAERRGMTVGLQVDERDHAIDLGHIADPRTRRFFTFAVVPDATDPSGHGLVATSNWCPMDDA